MQKDENFMPMKPWKRSWRKIPDWLNQKIKGMKQDNVIVACVKKITQSAVEAGDYRHLGIRIQDGKLIYPDSVVPPSSNGRYARMNVDGYEIVHKHLPKVMKTFEMESPNWGDWSNGTHTVYHDREVYQRDVYSPREIAIKLELLDTERGDENTYVVRFALDSVLNRKTKGFKDELHFAVNLLQESAGGIDAFTSDASRDEFLKTVYVNWELLPPGQRDANLTHLLKGLKVKDEVVRGKLQARYDLLSSMNPSAFIQGTSGFRRYFGAKFGDGVVVFENIEYGNAMYVMFEDWKALSKLSRLELLSKNPDGFKRIIHTEGWEEKVRAVIEKAQED